MKIQNGFSLKSLSPAERAAKQDESLRNAAKMYETHFLNEMMKSMRSTVNRDENSFMKPNMGEKIFSEQLDQQYTENWANKGGVGLGDMIYNQIKDQYMNTTKKDFAHPQKMLPIAPKAGPGGIQNPGSMQMKFIPTDKPTSASYRFTVPEPLGTAYEARAPMPGRVTEASQIGDNWNLVKLDHGRGLHSELSFPGPPPTIAGGEDVASGQKLGMLEPDRPVLAWNLDWSQGESENGASGPA